MIRLAKKRKALKKKNSKASTVKKSASKKTNDNNKVKVYNVDDSQKKEQIKTRREKNIQAFLIVLIVILAIAAIFSAIQTFFPDLFGEYTLSGELAAKVNGQAITVQQLDMEYERLPEQYKYVLTKELFLSQLIDEMLLKQEAMNQGTSVDEEEIDERIDSFVQDNNLTDEQLDDILDEKKLTHEDFRDLVRNQLLIEKLLEKNVLGKVNVTSELALQYYNDNPDAFKIPELAKVRHILINLVERTEEEAEQRANSVFKELENDKSNFCKLVNEYSDDAGSIDKCGEYTFPRGQMVEEFENFAFNQEIGDVNIVKTGFGYHIVWVVNRTAESLISYKDAEEQIIIILEKQQEKTIYSDFIVGLREKADIVNYLEEKAMKEAEAAAEKEAAEEPVEAPEEEISIVIEEEAEEEEVMEGEMPAEEEVEEALEEVVEEEIAEEEPAAEPAEELGFAECLAQQGAVLYGAYWDSSTKKQRDYFGADIGKINYVECGVEGDYRAQAIECADAGILAYPTWVIDGEKHLGILTPQELSALTGCEI